MIQLLILQILALIVFVFAARALFGFIERIEFSEDDPTEEVITDEFPHNPIAFNENIEDDVTEEHKILDFDTYFDGSNS